MTEISESLYRRGRYAEAWESLDDIPAQDRAEASILALRLRICIAVARWDMGCEIARILSISPRFDFRMASAEFYLAYAAHLAEKEFRNVEASAFVNRAIHLWPGCLANLPEGDICRSLSPLSS